MTAGPGLGNRCIASFVGIDSLLIIHMIIINL